MNKFKNKEKEADDLKKKLLVNQENQSEDITQMCKAITKDITSFHRDSKTYKTDLHNLKDFKIHQVLVNNNKHSLADYVFEEDIDQSKKSLEIRSEVMGTKMDKLNENNQTLKDIIQNMKMNLNENQELKNSDFKTLNEVYSKLKDIGNNAGLTIFDSNPDLLGKSDYSWSNSNEGDKKMYELLSIPVKSSISSFEDLFLVAKECYDEYITICKRTFEKLTNINTVIGKNEGERIKTLKSYEMFKKEYKYFQTPKCLPKCYSESIIEMNRRIKFKKFFNFAVEKLKSLIEYENKKRD